VINNNLDFIFHRFRDNATYSLKSSIENCFQTDAYKNIIITDSLQEVASTLPDGTIIIPLRLTV